ncbi:MAG: choice-of-anchor J domain-containing protein, partial [Bacteroidota bacterium]
VEGFDPETHDVYIAGSFPGDLDWNEPGTNDDLKLAPVPAAKNDPPLNLYDNFDSYDDFAVDADLAPWSTLVIDGHGTFGAQAFDFPGEGTEFGFMIMNPSATDPAIDDQHAAYDGEKYLIAVQDTTPNDNRWLITPEVSFNNTSELSFHVKSITGQWGLERFRVLVSTTDMETESFTRINEDVEDADYLEAPTDWTEFTFDLGEFDGETGYIAIQYVSHDSFIFMLDAFSLTAEDDNGNGGEELLYTIDLPVTEGTLEYKYSSDAIGEGWDGGEWPGDPDREITVTGDMVQNDVFGVYDQVSVENVLAEEGLNLFPNPVRENLTIDANEMINQVRIFDLTGRVVLDDIVNDTQLILNVSDFRQGAYLIQVTTESGVLNKKFNVVK